MAVEIGQEAKIKGEKKNYEFKTKFKTAKQNTLCATKRDVLTAAVC